MDDELEYRGRPARWIYRQKSRCTRAPRIFEFPIVAFVLFETIRGGSGGERMGSPTRASKWYGSRFEFWGTRQVHAPRVFGDDHWDCKDMPPEEGEGARSGSLFIKGPLRRRRRMACHLFVETSASCRRKAQQRSSTRHSGEAAGR